ncbi:MAG: 30S ribosomal protein S18 [bacterium]|nr:30S ribosomal protein S18 [bacterium]
MFNKPKRRRNVRRDRRPKICRFCENRAKYIDFLDVDTLMKFQTENGKMLPKRVTGTCPDHQKMLSKAIKRSRVLGLIL